MAAASPGLERYARDGALLFGGVVAILLQLGDPVVARGVAAHSAFATDPAGRLRRTLEYVYAVGLGPEDLERIARRGVDRAHRSVPGARDAEHQLWVAATLHAVGVDTVARLVAPLDDATADAVHRAAGRLGTALQLPADAWPPDRAAFARYWASSLARLEVTPEARAVAQDLLHPRRAPWWLRATMPFVREVTAALAPAGIREPFGLETDPARHARALRRARLLVRFTPGPVRRLPSRLLLRSLRRRTRCASARTRVAR